MLINKRVVSNPGPCSTSQFLILAWISLPEFHYLKPEIVFKSPRGWFYGIEGWLRHHRPCKSTATSAGCAFWRSMTLPWWQPAKPHTGRRAREKNRRA